MNFIVVTACYYGHVTYYTRNLQMHTFNVDENYRTIDLNILLTNSFNLSNSSSIKISWVPSIAMVTLTYLKVTPRNIQAGFKHCNVQYVSLLPHC